MLNNSFSVLFIMFLASLRVKYELPVLNSIVSAADITDSRHAHDRKAPRTAMDAGRNFQFFNGRGQLI